MMTMMRPRPLVAGNWKMNGLRTSLAELGLMAEGYDAALRARADLLVCPPATLLPLAAHAAVGTRIAIGGQDCHAAQGGAHTGDVSAEMLANAGATFVIVGHSERRADHG
jgi:triosephosphate isomerase